jgi:hypothetical protein
MPSCFVCLYYVYVLARIRYSLHPSGTRDLSVNVYIPEPRAKLSVSLHIHTQILQFMNRYELNISIVRTNVSVQYLSLLAPRYSSSLHPPRLAAALNLLYGIQLVTQPVLFCLVRVLSVSTFALQRLVRVKKTRTQ